MAIEITNVTFINGVDIKEVSITKIFDMIIKLEDEMDKMEKIQVKSSAVEARIMELDETIKQLAAFADEKADE